MIVIEIDPNLDAQSFRQDLDGESFLLQFLWNERDATWQFELYTPDETLIASAPLLPGVDLFREYRTYGTLPAGRFVFVDLRPGANEITRYDVGINVKLFYAGAIEYAAIIGA